ncbi:MAG: SpoIIE family protein phosphatase [Clostridia bacterium]|nr:SpoIIE family protein phosphatase [Clostridia bacterium]
MSTIRKLKKNLSFNIICSVVVILLMFSGIISVIGYISFYNSLTREYDETTYAICETAATLVDGDKIDAYLAGGEQEADYQLAQRRMDVLCEKMNVSLIYVIKVDTSDYGSFVSVFNSVNKKTDYTRWEAGYHREATNEEYCQMYQRLYSKQSDHEKIFRTRNLNGAPPHITSIINIENSKGEVTALLCVQRPMSALEEGRKPYLISISLAVVIAAVIAATVALNFLNRQFIKPLIEIRKEAQRFARENVAGNNKLDQSISHIDEIRILAASIEKMEEDTLKYIENLTQITSEQERIGAELDVARNIQEGSVPNVFPAFPDRKEFDIFASMTPAKEVGGDFYDFFLIDDDHFAMVIADVSGKGVPAALFMMVTKILIKERCRIAEGTPAEIVQYVNDRVCANNQADMFVTVWFGILEISTGKVFATNAGHNQPAICRGSGQFEFLPGPHSLVIGAMPDISFKTYEFTLQAGDKLFLYTDGVTEAINENKELFANSGMLNSLNKKKDGTAREILEQVKHDVHYFAGYAPQFDDITMLCLNYNGTENQMNKELHVEADIQNIDILNDFLSEYCSGIGCSMKVQTQLSVAAEEIFANIANYAYGEGSGYADVKLDCVEDKLSLVFEDSGIPYNPLKKPDPDIKLSAEERQIGGLGIYMAKKLTDDVTYRYEDGKNILKLVKIIK